MNSGTKATRGDAQRPLIRRPNRRSGRFEGRNPASRASGKQRHRASPSHGVGRELLVHPANCTAAFWERDRRCDYCATRFRCPFGFGWSLSLPSITRKTDKGITKYLDAEESIVFILSGAEDMVPVLAQNAQGKLERERPPALMVNGVTYRVDRYRPRIEGIFARIERWTNTSNATDVFWRSISKDNITLGTAKQPKAALPTQEIPVVSSVG